jgi:hypothetical protein
VEPKKRAIAFFDGQRFYHAVCATLGPSYSDFDALKLAQMVCPNDFHLMQVRFYIGTDDADNDPSWRLFRQKMLLLMSRQDVVCVKRAHECCRETSKGVGNLQVTRWVRAEIGQYARIDCDIINLLLHDEYDVAIVFSDHDGLPFVLDEVKKISATIHKTISFLLAYPVRSAILAKDDGSKGTWIKIDSQFCNEHVQEKS